MFGHSFRSVRFKLVAGVVVLGAVAVVSAAVSAGRLGAAQSGLSDANEYSGAILRVEVVKEQFVKQRALQAEYAFTGDDQLLEEFEATAEIAFGTVDEVVALYSDDPVIVEHAQRIEELDIIHDEAFFAELPPAVASGDRAATLAALDNSVRNLDALQAETDDMLGYLTGEAERLSGQLADDIDAAQAFANAAMLVAFLVALAVVAMVFRITSAMQRITDRLRSFGRGDTDGPVPGIERPDEIGQIGRSLATAIDGIRATSAALERLSVGDDDVVVVPVSEEDVLGRSAAELVRSNHQMAELLDAISRGETDVEVPVRSDNDRLAEAAQRLVSATRQRVDDETRMRHLIGRISESAGELAASSEELTATSEQVSSSAESSDGHAASVAEAGRRVDSAASAMRATMEELNSSISEIADSTEAVARQASDAHELSEETASIVQRLDDAGQNIGQVVDVINSVAEQTNLLALNAAIEAARAGEAGRGFAVVASEVKVLAEQTSTSTADIRDRVAQVQAECSSAVEANTRILGAIGSLRELASAIAAAVQQQSATSINVVERVEEVAAAATEIASAGDELLRASQGTTEGSREAATAAGGVADIAESLNALVVDQQG